MHIVISSINKLHKLVEQFQCKLACILYPI
jgi:hypothetical protein